MNFQYPVKTAAALALALTLLAGCKSKEDAAIDTAKQRAAATGQAQRVISTDRNGTMTTTTVQPPAPGQTAQAVTTTVTTTGTPGPGAAPGSLAGVPGTAPQSGYSQSATVPVQAGQPVIQPADVNIPAGTNLTIRINQHISVKTSRAGERFDGEVEEQVLGANNGVVIPRGAPVSGVVVESHRRGHFKGASILELRLTYLTLGGQRYALDTADLRRRKKGKGRRSAAFIGGGTGLGMLVGGVATGGVGLLVGGLVGAGAGTAVGGLTGNRDIEIPAESIVHFRLAQDLVVQPS